MCTFFYHLTLVYILQKCHKDRIVFPLHLTGFRLPDLPLNLTIKLNSPVKYQGNYFDFTIFKEGT